jgi:hypothetical protein
MRGTGADDYVRTEVTQTFIADLGIQVWVSPDGVGYLYGNSHNPPYWDPIGLEIFNTGMVRKALHLADFDGDGKVSYIF